MEQIQDKLSLDQMSYISKEHHWMHTFPGHFISADKVQHVDRHDANTIRGKHGQARSLMQDLTCADMLSRSGLTMLLSGLVVHAGQCQLMSTKSNRHAAEELFYVQMRCCMVSRRWLPE